MNSIIRRIESDGHIFNQNYIKQFSLLFSVILTALTLPVGIQVDTDQAFAQSVVGDFDTKLSNSMSEKRDPFNNEHNSKTTSLSGQGSVSGSQISAQSSSEVHGDFNGDGKDDIAIGVPGEDVDVSTGTGKVTDAGAVNVLYGSSNGLSATSPRADQFWTQNTADVNDNPESFDDFGSSLAAGDFNGDGRDDLAIGVPDEDLASSSGTIGDAGAVNILYGSSSGLSATSPRADQFWTQASPDVNDVAEEDDHFGSSLTAGDFNGDGRDDLAIGAEGNSGVNVLYGSSNGLSATSPRADQFWTGTSPNVNAGQTGSFGSSLTAGDFNGDGRDDLAIGIPSYSVDSPSGRVMSAGATEVLYGSSNGLSATSPLPDQLWTQNTANVDDNAESFDDFGSSLAAGDFNGDGRDDIAIGVDGEDLFVNGGTESEAGAVNVLYGSSSGLSATSPRADQFWTQDSPDVDGQAEGADGFGSSLAAGDFNGDGRDDIAIGADSESYGSIQFAGAVNVLYGSSNGLSATSALPDQFWSQDSPNVNDINEELDAFGSSLLSADFNGDGRDDLAIGIPNQVVGSGDGAVAVLYGSSSNGLSATSPLPDQFWTQDSPNVNDLPEASDFFGSSLG